MTGFNEVITMFPSLQIVASQSGDFTRSGGKTVMESFLSSMEPSTICAVWAHNDDMVIGAIEAIKEAGLDPSSDILTISVDAVPDIFKAMADGDANATVELSPEMGIQAYAAIKSHLAGETLPSLINVPGGMYFPDTAAEEYEARSGS